MLKLERLDVSGFKSFVDPVHVLFAGGITGIVGPNGCGKSNLSDAITWVLGEQSAKSMRGDTMEDVIFNGSEKRKPLGMGEVTLSFLADASFAGGALGEDGRVTISRRVFRTGESQYRLNGKTVRLKEIKDLLMDTGLGIRAYSVIEQGKIGLILSGKPQERRKLIEEAAGITRYKARKKIAELKLEEATANLLRLDDIVSEIERNLRSLKRQAGAARRFQERQAEWKTLHRAVLGGRWSRLASELAERRIALGESQTRETDLAANIHRQEAELAELREKIDRLATELSDKSRRQAELGATIAGRQQFLSGTRRTIAEIDARVAAGQAVSGKRREDLEAHGRTVGELTASRARLIVEHDQAAALVQADGARLREVESVAAAAEARLEAARQELLASLGELTALRNRIHREQIESEKSSFRQRHLFDELALRSQEITEASRGLATANARLAEIEALLGERHLELTAARETLAELLAREATAADVLRTLEHERTGRTERQRFLAELAEGDREKGRALAEHLAALGISEPATLGTRIHVMRGWERSLDLYLGDLIDAVVLSGELPAREVATLLADSAHASGTLLTPLSAEDGEAIAGGGAWPWPDDPAIVASLGDALGLEPEVAQALPPAYLVATPEDAERLARRHPGVSFLTRDRLWMQGGLIHLQSDEQQPGFLARASELTDLADLLPGLEERILAAQSEIQELVAARAAVAETIHRAQEAAGALKQEQAGVRSRRDDLAGRHQRLTEAEEGLQREQARLASELARLGEVQLGLGGDLEGLEARHAAQELQFDELQKEVEAARKERETQRALGAGRRGQLDVLTERLQSMDRESSRLAREIAAAERQIEEWMKESATLAARKSELEAAMQQAERELQEALDLRAGGEELLRRDGESLDGERQGARARQEALAAVRREHDQARGEVENLRIALVGLEHDATHLGAEHAEHFGEPLPEIPGELPPNLAEMEVDLARIKEQIEAIGPVNVLAADEYSGEEERHKFLSVQRADVAASVESLRHTIKEINQTSSERFKEAFAQVNAQFSKTFVDLFRGGEAEMRLLDEEDLMESGIEIVARPPGKRLQNLMLLSGGEKALTAIALLFALFRTKPSPFCILDEVDAPLDDINTLRFVGMLRELAKETQCIVITHNKLTMEVASTLYGVTMEERGVSKLVTVALEEVHPEAAAVSA
ncbi:MAG: chromosome segregation protein SMC [Thermoanaerobaculia bacterium]|nr:chromosome segregation protein SMC [Thermoanaerobaculia bacterium]